MELRSSDSFRKVLFNSEIMLKIIGCIAVARFSSYILFSFFGNKRNRFGKSKRRSSKRKVESEDPFYKLKALPPQQQSCIKPNIGLMVKEENNYRKEMAQPCKDTFKVKSRERSKENPHIIIFSGGTAFNSYVESFTTYLSDKITHILPISDNGGSTREIIRVLGGPAIGDIRSRLIRLAIENTPENIAIKKLLEYRLPLSSRNEAKYEFLQILEGSHNLWNQVSSSYPYEHIIPEAYKQTLRAFLVHFYSACISKSSIQELEYDDTIFWSAHHGSTSTSNFSPTTSQHRSKHVGKSSHHSMAELESFYVHNIGTPGIPVSSHPGEFDFRGGSIGNFVFTGARLFFHSLEAAIFWFSNLASIPRSSQVLPIILANSRMTIGAQLTDGSHVIGQENISHPPPANHMHIPPANGSSQSLTNLSSKNNYSGSSHIVHSSALSPLLHDQSKLLSNSQNSSPQHARVPVSATGNNSVTGSNLVTGHDIQISLSSASRSSTSIAGTAKDETGYIPLISPIDRIFYVNQYGAEIYPPINRSVLLSLNSADCVVYAMGSLYTSIIPSLIVTGVGSSIASRHCPKILILNGWHDRETFGMLASDFVSAVVKALRTGIDQEMELECNIDPSSTDEPSDTQNNRRNSDCFGKDCSGRLQEDRESWKNFHFFGSYDKDNSGDDEDGGDGDQSDSSTHIGAGTYPKKIPEYSRTFVTDVLYINSNYVCNEIVTEEERQLLQTVGIRSHAVAAVHPSTPLTPTPSSNLLSPRGTAVNPLSATLDIPSKIEIQDLLQTSTVDTNKMDVDSNLTLKFSYSKSELLTVIQNIIKEFDFSAQPITAKR